MSTSYMTVEMSAAGVRTRKAMFYSISIHVCLLLWLLIVHKVVPEEMGITEITWIDPVEEEAPKLPVNLAKSTPPMREEIPQETPSVHEKKEYFLRRNPLSTVAPKPQEPEAVADKFMERLTVLQDRSSDQPTKIAALTAPAPVGRKILAGVDTEKRSPSPVDLRRQGPTNSKPRELNRSPVTVQKSTMAMVPIPNADMKPAKMEDADTDTQRQLAGALLTGPVADRPLISFCKPEYPEWAKEEAVEGSVTIYFIVLPGGRIKENIMVQKTSGFSDFDDNAVNALLSWRFEPLKNGAGGEQWGTITFHYRLSDVN